MNDSTKPPILYKYCPPYRLEPLTEQTLRITQFNQLNDPLESLPVVTVSGGIKAADAKFENLALKEFRRRGGLGTQRGKKFREFLKMQAVLRDKLRQMATEGIEDEWHLENCRQIQDTMSKISGVICLVSAPDSLLMWSHYAKEHKGYAIGIDAGPLEWSGGLDPIGRISPVVYGTERPRVSGPKDYSQFFRKSDDWRYEKEWRIVLPLRVGILADADGSIYVSRFGANCLKEIVLGWRVAPNVVAETDRIKAAMPWVRIRKARPSAIHYKMIIEDA